MGAETQISQLVLEVSAQTALAQRSLNDLARVVQQSTGKMNSSLSNSSAAMKQFEGVISGAKSAVTGFVAAFAAGALAAEVKHSLEYAGSIAEVSRTLGVTTKDLQTFRYAATQTGVAQDQLEIGLRRLTISMGKAELGSKAQAKAFQAIGISVEQLKGKTTGDVFRLMADGLSKVTDRSQRAAIEMALLGKTGSTLDNLLAPGSKRLNELAEAAQRLGIVLSDSQIQGAEETAHKLAAVKEVLAAQIAGVVASNANAILQLSSALATLTGEIVRFLGSNPQLALGIVGALLGANIGKVAGGYGVIGGALAGGIGGIALGGHVAQVAADNNGDLAFRTQQMRSAQQRYFDAQKSAGAGNRAMPGVGLSLGGSNDVASAKAEWIRQIHLLQDATAQARAALQQKPVGTQLPQFLGSGGTRHPHQKVDHTAENEDEFARQMAQLDAELLAARKATVAGYDTQADLAAQEVEAQKQVQLQDVQKKLDLGKATKYRQGINQAQADELVLQINAVAAAKEAAIAHKKYVDSVEQLAESAGQQAQFQVDDLRFADEMATTSGEHRKLQLAILDIQYQVKKAELERLLMLLKSNKDFATSLDLQQQAADIQAQIAHLPIENAQNQERVNNGTLDPLAQWAKQVPKTAGEIIEALKSIEAQGIDGLASAIGDVITGTKSLKSAFKDLASSVISDILQMTIKMLIFRALSSVFGGVFGGGGASGINIGGGTSSYFAANPIGARAAGGPVTGGSPYIVGEKGPELFVPGGSGVIVPNSSRIGAPRAANSNDAAHTIVELRLNDDMLDARIVQGAAQVVMVSAPSIAKAAHGATMKRLTRPAIAGRG